MFIVIISIMLAFDAVLSAVNIILKWCKYYDDRKGYLKIDNIGKASMLKPTSQTTKANEINSQHKYSAEGFE